MNKLVIICFLAIIATAVAGDDEYDSYDYKNSRKVVVVENEPRYQVIRREPEYKKTIYKYREPEDRQVVVKVIKPSESRYIPSNDSKKDVVVKILNRKH
ncbi:unnamed protein product [Ceutorhynchus assimilis]|uniref:Uncharacterized protein n=1 Tax=Ceutorhynchus assimilis TaxID=467358 RepID=A0A9N9MQ60_9CUCU|nr:unnamed protein product [Ceutorhynchus assimilis]